MAVNKTTKEAIIGLRRKNEARGRIGQMLFSMYRQNIDRIHGIRKVSYLLHMDHRVLKKHLHFRIYPQGGRDQYIIHLDTEDMAVIKRVFDIFQSFRTLDPDRQQIAQYIFLHLIKHG